MYQSEKNISNKIQRPQIEIAKKLDVFNTQMKELLKRSDAICRALENRKYYLTAYLASPKRLDSFDKRTLRFMRAHRSLWTELEDAILANIKNRRDYMENIFSETRIKTGIKTLKRVMTWLERDILI